MKLTICMAVLFASVALILAGPMPLPAAAAAPTNPPSVLVVAPYLQDLAETGVTIIWRSDRPSYGFVEYGEDASLGQKAESVRDGLKAANVEWHRADISNLKPGVRYHYRVIDRAIVSFGPYKTVLRRMLFPRQMYLPPRLLPRRRCVA